jgi:hypothetical protein
MPSSPVVIPSFASKLRSSPSAWVVQQACNLAWKLHVELVEQRS